MKHLGLAVWFGVLGPAAWGTEPAPALPTTQRYELPKQDTRVGAVAFSVDGKTLLVAARGIDLWDVATGKRNSVAFDHPGNAGIASAVLAPDGKRTVTASSGLVRRGDRFVAAGFLCLFDAGTGKLLADRECHGESVHAIALTPDGKLLVSGGADGRVRLWDPATLKEKASLEGHDSPVLAVAVSADGKLLATAESEGAIRVWDLPGAKHRATLRGHRDRVPIKGQAPLVRALAFAPDGKLASGDYWGHVAVWEVAKEKAMAEFALPDSDTVHSLAFTPDGKTLAVGGKNVVRFWTTDGAKELAAVKGHANGVYALAFSPDGTAMATGDDSRARLFGPPAPK